jgi:hypothetical protein
MPLRSARPPAPRTRRDVELERTIEEYLAVSRSPLRLSEPAWHTLAEAAAWERVCRAAGIAAPPDCVTRGAPC